MLIDLELTLWQTQIHPYMYIYLQSAFIVTKVAHPYTQGLELNKSELCHV